MPPMPPVIQALLLINVAVYCLQVFTGDLLVRWFALWPMGSGFLPWQPLSYAFLHGDTMHLFFNMLGLWMFGAELERVWNTKRMLQFYAASVLTAAAVQLLVQAVLGSGAPTVGASGGVFGVLLAYAMMFPTRRIMLLIPPVEISARTLAIIFGVLELVRGVSAPAGGVAHFAHLGGMLGAFLTIRYWRGQPPFGRR